MKKYLIFILLVSVLSAVAGYFENPALSWLYPRPTRGTIRDMAWTSPTNGLLVSSYSELLYTNNGGESFSFAQINPEAPEVDYDLHDAFFLNETTGWVVGYNFYAKTEDGGASYNRSYIGSGEFFSVQFTDEMTGTIVGASNKILRTIDGGSTWSAQGVSGGGDWYDVHFHDLSEGWVAGWAGLAYTNTAGAFWTLAEPGSFAALDFVDTSNGWAVGENGLLKQTIDGGVTWQNVVLPESFDLTDVDFWSVSEGWITGDGSNSVSAVPVVFHTVDGGATWSLDTLQVPDPDSYYKHCWTVSAVAAGTCYSGGDNGLLHSTDDGGSSWNLITEAVSSENIYDVYFIDTQQGWAVGGDSKVIYTMDGGENWEDRTPTPGSYSGLLTVHFNPDGLNGWAAGGSGYAIRTEDGGLTWTTLNLGITDVIWDIAFNNTGFGIATYGHSGELLQSHDWGVTWEAVPVSAGSTAKLVRFASESSGFVASEAGTFLRFDMQGDSWCNLNNPHAFGTADLFPLSEDVVYATALDWWNPEAKYYMSTNGGGTWELVYTGFNGEFRSLYFENESSGVLLLGDNHMAVTSDGGGTWTTHCLPGPVQEHTNAFFVDSEHAWIPYPGILELSFSTTGTWQQTQHQVEATAHGVTVSPSPVREGFATAVYTVPAPGVCRLSVFDLSGRVVHREILGELPVGQHSSIITTELPGGVYFCTIEQPVGRSKTMFVVLR